jgi:hypothetical protein
VPVTPVTQEGETGTPVQDQPRQKVSGPSYPPTYKLYEEAQVGGCGPREALDKKHKTLSDK